MKGHPVKDLDSNVRGVCVCVCCHREGETQLSPKYKATLALTEMTLPIFTDALLIKGKAVILGTTKNRSILVTFIIDFIAFSLLLLSPFSPPLHFFFLGSSRQSRTMLWVGRHEGFKGGGATSDSSIKKGCSFIFKFYFFNHTLQILLQWCLP